MQTLKWIQSFLQDQTQIVAIDSMASASEQIDSQCVQVHVSEGTYYGPILFKASNYHPVSLTCVVCKCIEHIVATQVMQHLTKNNILYNHQHGFRSKLSTQTQLIEFNKDMLRGMKDGKQSDVVVMDFAKAFEKVSHTRLLHKLHIE